MSQINFNQLAQILSASQNPIGVLKAMVGDDPRLAQAMQLAQGKSSDAIRQMALQMCKERGINLEDILRQLR